MALTTQAVELNILTNCIEPKVYAVQSDTGRAIQCEIMDWEIPSGATAKVIVEKPSGEVASGECTISGNYATMTLTQDMLSERGRASFCLEITSGEQTVTTFQGYLIIRKKSS